MNLPSDFDRNIGQGLADSRDLSPDSTPLPTPRCTTKAQVLVLVSGGSDSVALLLALEHAAKIFLPALRVEAAHFNHALRGEDSDADEEFVKDMASRLGVPLHVRRWRGTRNRAYMKIRSLENSEYCRLRKKEGLHDNSTKLCRIGWAFLC